MKKKDKGLEELLGLLKTHPDLIRDLVFDPTSIKRLLKSRAARRLVNPGMDATAFLECVASSEGGYPIAQCFGGTRYLCAKGTQCALCAGGTRPY